MPSIKHDFMTKTCAFELGQN